MLYNVDFLIAGLIILCLVLLQFQLTRAKKRGLSSKVFLAMLSVCILDVALDAVTAYLIQHAADYSLVVLYVANSAFFLSQILVTAMLYLYAVAICNNFRREYAVSLVVSVIPLLLFAVLTLSNPVTHVFFSFDTVTHEYSHGPYIYLLYMLAFFYSIVTIGYSTLCRKLMRGIDYLAIWEFCVIAITCVFLQARYPDLLMTGFGIGLGAMVVFLTINNTDGMFDAQSNVFDIEGFRRQIDTMIQRKADASLVFVSLEMLRTLNKLGGPSISDSIIQEVAAQLRALSRTKMVFRMKGSQFVVLCDSRREQRRIFHQITTWLDQTHPVHGMPARISYRAGTVDSVAVFDSSYEIQSYLEYLLSYMRRNDMTVLPDALSLLKDYQFERKIAVFNNQAMEQNLFSVYAQPLYGVKEQRFVGFEILSRLFHPDLGFISPEVFIRLAEEEGTVGKLGALQYANALEFVKDNRDRLRAAGVTQMKFNVSAVELIDPMLPLRILDRIKNLELDPDMFGFEITETSAVKYGESSERFVTLLQEAGCHVLLDDFGSGYANLDSVMNLPFQGVKMDMTLLRSASADENARTLYSGLVGIMKGLGKSIVSEGVETVEQADYLKNLGVDLLQGYLLCKPLPIEEAVAFVEKANAEGRW
ncbi:MAG: EAL domain-containing protein [Coriobacteriia bacterium]|nr:EAL domain-containing protein [Coriobacteriia bacterium]